MVPSNLKKAIEDFVSFVNFLGPEGNPFVSTANFKSLDPTKTEGILSILLIFSQNNMHLLSQFLACNNFVLLNMRLNELSSI